MLWSLLFISLIGSAHNDCGRAPVETQNVTSQSSYYVDEEEVKYFSGRAVDGNMELCAHTLTVQNSWWTIDLLGVYNISCIEIYNIEQPNTDLSGAQIHIGNSRENNGTTNRLCKTITHFTKHTWNVYKCNASISGRYITVFLPRDGHVILCEVRINATMKDSPFVLIKAEKTWEDALYHCRDNNMVLASILDQETQAWAELEAKEANTPFVWLGLRYTCTLEFWFWAEDHRLDFSRWAEKTEECDMSGAMETTEDHRWFSKHDHEKFNFICAK